MTFKSNWEKADQNHHISSETIHNMVKLALPSKKLLKNEIISGGCANLNIKIICNYSPVSQNWVLSHLLKFRHISVIFERNSGGRYAQN